MRKLLLAVLGITVLIVACENKSPVGPEGPGGVTVTQTTSSTTTTTSTPTTTSTTSTTTTVPGGASRRYMAFQPPPNIPADMTLFFELIFNGLSPLSRVMSGRPLLGAIEAEYRVTGVYVMGNGTVGDVFGTLGNSPNPLETVGTFDGRLTAKLPNCTAERAFSGTMSSQTLQWEGGQTLRDCAGSPLSFASLTMLRSGGDAPLPTTTIASTTSTVASTTTTSVAPTTTSTSSSSSTTSTTCSYSVFPTAIDAPSAGTPAGTSITFQIVTGPGCGWTAVQQASTPWLTGLTPTAGNGPQVAAFSVACFQDDSAPNIFRTATITVNGAVLTVRQQAGVRFTCPSTPAPVRSR